MWALNFCWKIKKWWKKNQRKLNCSYGKVSHTLKIQSFSIIVTTSRCKASSFQKRWDRNLTELASMTGWFHASNSSTYPVFHHTQLMQSFFYFTQLFLYHTENYCRYFDHKVINLIHRIITKLSYFGNIFIVKCNFCENL